MMWMPFFFRERARSYKGFGFHLAFVEGQSGAIVSKLAQGFVFGMAFVG
jgi:hypothetical protein